MPSTGWSQALNLKNLEPVAAISTIPNILGYSNIAGYYDLVTASGGALSACSRWTFSIAREPGTAGGIINIDASGSNPIYGASTTNQPASLRGYMLIRYQ